MSTMQEYTKEQVAEHCTRESCWVYIGNNVYDLTSYLPKHPPGAGMILNISKKGADGKGMFTMHSKKAKSIWESYKIGTINE